MFDRYQQGHVLHQQVPPRSGFRPPTDSNATQNADHHQQQQQQQTLISQPSPIRGTTFAQMDIQPPLRTRSTPPTADSIQQPRFTPHKSNGPTMGPMPSAYAGLSQPHSYGPVYAMPDMYAGYSMGHGYMHNTYLQQQQAQRMPIHQPTKRASKALQIVDPATGKPIVLDELQTPKNDPAQIVTPKTSRPNRIQASPINSALVLSCANNNAGYSKSPMSPIHSPPSGPLSGVSSKQPVQDDVAIDISSDYSSSKDMIDHQKAKDASKSLRKIDIPKGSVQLQNSAPPIDSSSVKASSKNLQDGRASKAFKDLPTKNVSSPVMTDVSSRNAGSPSPERLISPIQKHGGPALRKLDSDSVRNVELSSKPSAPAESPSEKSTRSSIVAPSPRPLGAPDSSTKNFLPTLARGHSPTPSQIAGTNQLDNIPEVSFDSKNRASCPQQAPTNPNVGASRRPVEQMFVVRPASPEFHPSPPNSPRSDFGSEDDGVHQRLFVDKSALQRLSETVTILARRYTVEEVLSMQKACEGFPEGIAMDSACLKQNSLSSSGRPARGSDAGHRNSRSNPSNFKSASHGDSHNANGNRRLSFREDGDRHNDKRHDRGHHRRTSHKSSAKELVRHEEPVVPPLHKSETRWVPRQKITDDDEVLKRKIKAVLNKITLDKFETLSKHFLELVQEKVTSVDQLKIVVELIFDKALSEPTFVKMYSSLCVAIAESMPEFQTDDSNGASSEDRRSQTFKRLLLNQCQQEFERGTSFGVDPILDEEERERSFRLQKNRFLGNVRFIGELFKDCMLAERIMHTCIYHFLQEAIQPMEEDIEALCKLLATIGKKFDRPQAKSHIDSYFNRMLMMSTNQSLSRRARFMLLDAIDLRKSRWNPRRKEVEAKTIDEFRHDMEREAAEQNSRSSRNGSRFDTFTGRGPVSKPSNQGW